MKTPITYYGGKQQLAAEIIKMMPKHSIYCEPYFGGGAVFFAKKPSYLEVINDKNDLLITFYKQCVENFYVLQQKINHTLHSESEFNKAKKIYNEPFKHKEIDIAWAVWVVTNMSIMATPVGGWKRDNGTGGSHMGVVFDSYRRAFTYRINERLRFVQISCRDAIGVIKDRDSAETFFYLDPPYINCDQKHYRGFDKEQFIQLLGVLTKIKGRFILSNFGSDILSEYIEKMHWQYRVIKRKSMIPALGSKPRIKQEILVYNYDIPYELF